MDQLKTVLNDWNKSKTERQKLQHTYVALIVIAIVVAGLVSLVNPDRGQQLTMVALVALLAFLLNAVVWNLLQSGLLSRLNSRTRRK
jgi:cell division protein FtsW (lipid II flippase)